MPAELLDHGAGEMALAHVGQGLGIDHVVLVAGAQQLEEILAALGAHPQELENVVAKKVKRSSPIWVVTPFLLRCRAPVSSTVIQGALSKPARSTASASSEKAATLLVRRRSTWRFEITKPRLVDTDFPDSPGSLEEFDYPVNHDQADGALRDFVEHRLSHFGRYQDAMASDRPFLHHSRMSAVMNLHLLDPRVALEAAIAAYENGDAPLNSVEGFVRQILGWREYIRGVYWLKMPDYAEMNALGADLPMPAFMWTAESDMNCIRQSVGQLIEHAYAHHIQRLMVLGLFAMLLGVRPYDVHRWHMSMYADAIDWVSLPNVLGMSQYGDGGIVGSKPYCASGNYINRMSDYCRGCRFDPKEATGDEEARVCKDIPDAACRHQPRNFLTHLVSRSETGARLGSGCARRTCRRDRAAGAGARVAGMLLSLGILPLTAASIAAGGDGGFLARWQHRRSKAPRVRLPCPDRRHVPARRRRPIDQAIEIGQPRRHHFGKRAHPAGLSCPPVFGSMVIDGEIVSSQRFFERQPLSILMKKEPGGESWLQGGGR